MSSVVTSKDQVVERVDAIVVGLGPAGSTALRLLSEAGLRVVGLDRAVFPRQKTCGGGLSARAIPLLPKGWDSVSHTVSTGVHLVYGSQPPVLLDLGIPIAYQFDRVDLDAFLLERAVDAGAKVIQGSNITSLLWDKGMFRIVCAPGNAFEAPFLIAADGVTSAVARFLGKSDPLFKPGVFLRKKGSLSAYPSSETEIEGKLPDNDSDVLIDLGSVSGGYGWSFPKKEGKKNVGVVGFAKPLGQPLEILRSFVKNFPGQKEPLQSVTKPATWLIPDFTRFSGHGRYPGLFFVGDAGAMVDPFLGEGIYYAMLSAKKAVAELLVHRRNPEKASRSYAGWVSRDMFREFAQAKRLSSVIYRFPGIYFRLVQRYPHVLSLYASIMTGAHNYRSFSRTIGKNLLRLPFRKFLPKFRHNRLI